MKTRRYFIEFYSNEIALSTEIDLTQKEYLKQLDFLTEQVEKSKSFEYPVEKSVNYFNQRPDYNETITGFSSGLGSTYLILQECKEGYRFLSKRELNKRS